MTLGAWIACVVIIAMFLAFGFGILPAIADNDRRTRRIGGTIAVVLSAALFFGLLWYYNSTASGRRALLDQRSELQNGLNRTVTVYTANGDVLAQYNGKIDIEANDGGYIKFDFEGKRYIYYNCFVESIAEV